MTASTADDAGTAVDPPAAPAPPSRDASWRPADVLALVVVLLVALAFRVGGIDAMPSADEIWHLALSRGEGSPVGRYAPDVAYVDAPPLTTLDGAAPAWRVWTRMDGVLHPPLYVLTLRLWRDVFGPADAAGHALSIAWSCVAAGFVFASARLALGRAAAVWATLVMAVAPVQIYFAQEIRGYEMMIGLGAIALWLATRIEVLGPTPRRAAGLALLTLPLLLTHYFAAGGVAGIAAYAVLRLRGRPGVAFVVGGVVAALTYSIIWLPFAVRQITSIHTGDAFARVPHFDIFREAPWALGIPARVLVEKPWISSAAGGITAVAFSVALLAGPWYRRKRLPALAPWAAWLCGSVAALVVLDVARTTWLVQIVRYAAVASPAVPLLFVGLARSFGPRALHAASGLAVALMIVARPEGGATIADAPQFGGTARWLAGQIAPGEAILVVQGTAGEHTADLVLLTLAHQPGLFPRTIVKVDGPLTPEALRALPDRAWAVMVDRDDARVVRALSAATLLQSYGIPDEGMCDLYDLSDAKRVAATTRPGR